MPEETQRSRPQNGAASGKLDTAPHDLGAEAAVLSAVCVSADALDVVRDLLDAADFYSGANRTIFEAVLELDAGASAVDVVTIAAQLRAMGKLNQVGGTQYLATLIDATPSVSNLAEHAQLVRSLAVLRRAATMFRELAILATAPETRSRVPEFLESCEARVFAATAAPAAPDHDGTFRDLMASAITDLDPSRPREARGITTGMPSLDELTMGLIPGELWYVAARPGMGKTALALGISQAVARTGRHALFFSLEMKRIELRDRIISSTSGVPYKGLLQNAATPEQWGTVMTTVGELSTLPFHIDDRRDLTPARLRSRTRKHAAALRRRFALGRVALIVVDYVQLMAGDDEKNRNRNDELERISRALKLLAGEFECTVVALSQLSRPKPGGSSRPQPSDLRGSGALEQDADKVLFVHREDESEGDERGDAELILAKGRNAGKGKVLVTWQPWCVRFVDSSQAGFDFGSLDYDGPESGARY